jgi:type I restriction enzyme S subunit
MKKFLDCISIVGATPSKFHGTKKYVSTGAVATTEIDESKVVEVTYEDRPSRANLSAEAGDILFAKMQGTRKTLLLDSETEKNIYSTGFYAVRANPEVITTECLYYLIDSELFLAQKDKNCSGATQKAITNGGMAKIEISVPALSEQGIFVDKLKHLTQLIADKKKQLNLFDEIIKSRFIEMFGNPKNNPNGYLKKRLKDTCRVITGNTPSRAVSEYYGNSIEWIKTDNIVEGMLHPTVATESLSEKGLDVGRTVESDSILMACIAGSLSSIGRVCVTDRKVAFNQQINAIEPNDYNALFLYVMLQLSKEYLIEEINMALKGILSKSKLEGKVFIVPPMDLQQRFAAFVEQVDKSKLAIQQSLEKLETLKKALMQQYFG